jgi:ABC transporter substrate binding protein
MAATNRRPRVGQPASYCVAFRGRANGLLGLRPILSAIGYTEGDNFDFAARFADGYIERLPPLAQELVQLRPRVILAPASGPAVAAKAATAIIPIVCPALADAVHLGLVASVSRPGSNVTGILRTSTDCPLNRWSLRARSCPAQPGSGSWPT